MSPSHFSEDTWEFIQLLDRHEVAYLLVGGEAVIHYGRVRLTGDCDFFYGTSPENADKLFRALLDFWGGDIPDIQAASELLVPDQVLQFGRPPNRIDLLTRISGVEFIDAWKARETIIAEDGTPVHLIALEHLLRNKRASGRPKDLEDAAFLEAASQSRSGT